MFVQCEHGWSINLQRTRETNYLYRCTYIGKREEYIHVNVNVHVGTFSTLIAGIS